MSVLEQLRRDGIALLAEPVAVAPMVAHLRAGWVVNAHVAAYASAAPVELGRVLDSGCWPMCCHSMADVLRAPGFLRQALAVRGLAEAYFGEEALLYSVNAFWTQPSRGPRYNQTHGWHRDMDDRKFLTLFIYGTDVLSAEDGSHRYFMGSHHESGPAPADVEARASEILGEAGLAFIEDGHGLHRGLRPLTGPRLMLWARWGVSEPPASYRWDRLSPVDPRELLEGQYPDDPAERRAIRLVVS